MAKTVTFIRHHDSDVREPTPEGIEIGYRLRTIFREAGIGDNQVEIAKNLKVSQMTVSYWLRGIKIPPIRTGIIIAKKAGVNVEWIYTGRGNKYPNPQDSLITIARELEQAPSTFLTMLKGLLKNKDFR